MTHDQIIHILTEHFGAQQEGDHVSLGDQRATALIEHTGGVLAVSKVHRVTLHGDLVALTTDEEELYVAREAVFAIRREVKPAEQRPGFGR